MDYNWSPYAIGGALRPDSFTRMTPSMQSGLFGLLQAADEEVGPGLQVYSGYRSPELQGKLFNEALNQYGTEQAARKWVAPPGKSRHNSGQAADLKYNGTRIDQLPEDHPVREWLPANAERFGLALPLAHEPWQVEVAGARDVPIMQETIARDAAASAGPGLDSIFADYEANKRSDALMGLASVAAGLGEPERPAPIAPMPSQPMQLKRRDTLSPYMTLFGGLQNGRF